MNTSSLQYKYLVQLGKLNPTMTVGQAIHRLKTMNLYIAKYKCMKE